ncbi:MAG: GlsB/YeaQ/YmgE family stress response membrane protein, partial [Polyangiaceae bacterium]
SRGGTGLASTGRMTLIEFIVYLVIAGICGAIARAVAGGTRGGFIVSVLLGFLGAFLGTWIARMTRLPELVMVDIGGHHFPVVWSIVGGMVLVAIAHALTRPRWIDRYVR